MRRQVMKSCFKCTCLTSMKQRSRDGFADSGRGRARRSDTTSKPHTKAKPLCPPAQFPPATALTLLARPRTAGQAQSPFVDCGVGSSAVSRIGCPSLRTSMHVCEFVEPRRRPSCLGGGRTEGSTPAAPRKWSVVSRSRPLCIQILLFAPPGV